MNLHDYLSTLEKRYQNGISKEHSYRGDLERLLRTIVPEMEVTNEPASVTDCGNPDYVLMRGEIPLGYIEAKDIGKDLNAKQFKEQFERYRKALDNLIITDYLWFQFYQNGALVFEIHIGEIKDGKIVPLVDSFPIFENRIKDFCTFVGQTIKSAQTLAELMAGKARLLQNTLENAVTSDEEHDDNTALKDQLSAFKKMLIHDIKPSEFADIYAQTLAYGMFAARLHDSSLDTFSRQEAAELIPKSNPFLRKLFQYIAGYDIDERIRRTVDNLAEVFRATDVRALLQNFGSTTQQNDPVIHFYETFLAKYDPKLRKARGVWYTPEPVVNFIVRAVDDILKTEFGIKDGLADTSKTTIKVDTQTSDKRSKTGYKQVEKEVHRVQILDPATGTGTFLAEIVKHIYHGRFKAMQGIWSGYVENDLIPRLNGFELLMASYAMAHLKLDLLLTETGYQPKKPQRFRVFLTNSLEEHHPDTGTLFASWLSNEAQEANYIKRDTPVMVVLGNPPYSGHSSNKGAWMDELLVDYKQEPGGGRLQERNPKWLNDDYVKFIRYGQHFIDKNGEGVLAYVNNHSFLDNPTFRGMRWHLLTSFDTIYIIDLHGNSKKKETCPDGSPDKNVFDIMQGVSINLFVKTGRKKAGELAKVLHCDVYGVREEKHRFLWEHGLRDVEFIELKNTPPYYLFSQQDIGLKLQYDKGFQITELMPVNVLGFQTHRDKFAIAFDHFEMYQQIREMREQNVSDSEYSYKYGLKDNRDWKLAKARQDLRNNSQWEKSLIVCSYRPFDERYCYFSEVAMDYPRKELKQHVQAQENYCLNITRQTKMNFWGHIIISNTPTPALFVEVKDGSNIFPLYLYPDQENQQQSLTNEPTKKPNLNPEIVQQIAARLGLPFEAEQTDNTAPSGTFPSGREQKTCFTPLDILDYIYAILHSPNYRQTYKEFLKIDFPRIPYPENQNQFWQLIKLGGELRQLHLLESPKVEQYITAYPQDGDNTITRKISKTDWEPNDHNTGRIWINDQQYFDKVPLIAWEFYIGGYQPAQKWLKDRKGRTLNFDDILHYQKIIIALTETARLMREIDEVLELR